MSTYLGDPTSEKYVVFINERRRQIESINALLDLLYKLGIRKSIRGRFYGQC